MLAADENAFDFSPANATTNCFFGAAPASAEIGDRKKVSMAGLALLVRARGPAQSFHTFI